MVKYVIKRIVAAFVTLLIASSLLFVILQFMPGKPYDNKLDPASREAEMDRLDLDEPMALRYFQFITGVVGFETDIEDGQVVSMEYKFFPQFGKSWTGQENSVSDELIKKYPVSIRIGAQALILGLTVGIFFGIMAALKRNTWVDNLISTVSVIGVSVPSFVFASLLAWAIGAQLGFVNLMIYNLSIPIISSILPTIALSLFVISTMTRYMRTELIDVLNSDYILLAQAKGLDKKSVVTRHAIRNALIPVITVIGPLSLAILGGSMVVEDIFSIPGMGPALVDAVFANDHPMVLGISFYYSLFYIIIILLIDISYGIIDPRVRVTGGGE